MKKAIIIGATNQPRVAVGGNTVRKAEESCIVPEICELVYCTPTNTTAEATIVLHYNSRMISIRILYSK